MRVIRTTLAVLVAALLVAGPAEAGKTNTYAPPGKAGTSEYAEVVPTAGGNVSPPVLGGSANKTAAQISNLGAGKAGAHKLSKLGKQGAAAAQFAQQTAPTVVHSAHGLGPQSARTPSTRLRVSSGESALSGVSHLLGGSDAGGMGVFLPLLLAFGLGAALAFAILRLRRPRGATSPRA
jgi:hypothetical protein